MTTADPAVQQALPFLDQPPAEPCHPAESDLAGDERLLPAVPGLVLAEDIAGIDQETPHWLAGADFVVVDVETTGWLADAAVITEIGAIRLDRGQLDAVRPGDEFSALVHPGVAIPAAITELTGITDEMVAGAPGIGEVLPEFLDFAAGAVLVAHNAAFDIGFLSSACDACGLPWPAFRVIDTAMLSRLALGPGDVPDHKLTTLAGYFRTAAGPCHRALDDARATAGVLAGLLGLLAPR